MLKVKIGELRNNLSKFLHRVQRGQTLIITDRDRPVGRLVPYEADAGKAEPFEIVPPADGYAGFGKIRFQRPKKLKAFDSVQELLKDRRRR